MIFTESGFPDSFFVFILEYQWEILYYICVYYEKEKRS